MNADGALATLVTGAALIGIAGGNGDFGFLNAVECERLWKPAQP